VLSRLEGTAAIPIFMMIVGVAWSRSEVLRQRRMALIAAGLGCFYFVQGGMWMLQSTPSVGFAQTVNGQPVQQSQDYSCVPAASATALNLLSIYTTEAEMAKLTETRPGNGATTIRALNGVRRRLASTPYRAELVELKYEGLVGAPMPALSALQFEPGRRHMVTLLNVSSQHIAIHDPVQGTVNLPRDIFEQFYRGEVILILPR
jgi:predicted double-glycine peptidase